MPSYDDLTLAVSLLLLLAHSSVSVKLSPTQVTVDSDGKYQNLTIFINSRVERSEEADYLNSVKEQISHLSEDVYHTLGLQFGSVTILVPAHWDSRDYSTTYNQGPETADIIVLPLSSAAYTQHIQGCGAEALHLKINSDYIRSESGSTSERRRLILHYWLHARYGVFDEHPLKSKAAAVVDQQKFYHSSDSTIEAVRCNSKLRTETSCQVTEKESYADLDRENSLPKSSCDFTVSPPSNEMASLMSHYTVENVTLPCNATTHNREAPNQHNRLCQGLSVQEVIDRHQDFSLRQSEQQKAKSEYEAPIFNTKSLRRRGRTLAFVLDSSNSMNGSRLFAATQAISSMIENVIEDFAHILIVNFDKKAYQLYPENENELVELDSYDTRKQAIQSLRDVRTGGHTCIGCGLQLAYNITEEAGRSKATLVLLTDGKDTTNQHIKEQMYNKSKTESFIIDTILLSDEADENLVALARDSGSAAFSANEDSSALIDAFTQIITNRQNYTSQVVQIYNRKIKTKPGQTQTDSFSLEVHLSKMAKLTFYMDSFDTTPSALTFRLVRENDSEVLYNGITKSEGFGYFTVPLDTGGDFQANDSVRFTFSIINYEKTTSHHSVVTVNTRSAKSEGVVRRRRDTESYTSYDHSYSMKAYVDGETNLTITTDSPVPMISLYAFLPPDSVPSPPDSVIATVTVVSMNQSQSDEFEIRLRDGGVAADVIKGDNVFSAHFTKFVSYNATYSVRVRASGSGYMRYASTGYFSVYIEPGLDISAFIPPATILDLQVNQATANKVRLSFTNTGADLDSGRAYQYHVIYSDDYKLIRRGDSLTEGLHTIILPDTPGEPYHQITVEFKLPNKEFGNNHTLWFAIRTVDKERGTFGNISNIVSARFISRVNIWLYIIFSIVVMVVILIFIICCVVCYFRKMQDRLQNEHLKSRSISSESGTESLSQASVNVVNDHAEQDDKTKEINIDMTPTSGASNQNRRTKPFTFLASRKRKHKQRKETKPPPLPLSLSQASVNVVNDNAEQEDKTKEINFDMTQRKETKPPPLPLSLSQASVNVVNDNAEQEDKTKEINFDMTQRKETKPPPLPPRIHNGSDDVGLTEPPQSMTTNNNNHHPTTTATYDNPQYQASTLDRDEGRQQPLAVYNGNANPHIVIISY